RHHAFRKLPHRLAGAEERALLNWCRAERRDRLLDLGADRSTLPRRHVLITERIFGLGHRPAAVDPIHHLKLLAAEGSSIALSCCTEHIRRLQYRPAEAHCAGQNALTELKVLLWIGDAFEEAITALLLLGWSFRLRRLVTVE